MGPSPAASNGFAVRCVNLQAALNLLREGDPLPSPQVCELLGVHPSTVARIMGTLQEAGLVVEAADGKEPAIGRPPKVWQISRSAGYALGVAVHPTVLRATLVDLTGLPCERRTHQYDPPLTAERLTRAVAEIVDSTTEGISADRILGMGAAVSGVVDPDTGVISFSGGLFRDPGVIVTDYPLEAELQALFPWGVSIANDANVGALASYRRKIHRGELGPASSLMYIMAVDSFWGFGAGLVVAGHLYTGAHGAAGEILHPRLLAEEPDWRDLPRRALAGDGEAVARLLERLAPVLEHFTALAMTFDADCVVMGGALAALGEPIKDAVAKMITATPGFGAYLADLPERALTLDPTWPDTIATGAAELVLEDLFREPTVGAPGRLVRLALGSS